MQLKTWEQLTKMATDHQMKIEALEAERDRLRDALEKLENKAYAKGESEYDGGGGRKMWLVYQYPLNTSLLDALQGGE